MKKCKYRNCYYRIIEKYADVGDILERHHIIPKSMGGTNDSENLVNVSPRVHFILHQLLYKMTKGEDKAKMYYAVLLMGNTRQIKTGAHYQLLKEQLPSIQSKRMKGNIPWNKGKSGCFSEETINKMSKTRKGKIHTSKLTPDKVRSIRSLYTTRPSLKGVGDIQPNGRVLPYERAFSRHYAEEFGITPNNLYKIILHKSWTNV